MTIQSGVDLREGNLALGLFGRVRLLMQDDPRSGVVRSRDWDEASDFAHILRYLTYHRTFASSAGPLRFQAGAGELLGFTLGHGTLVRDYSNISDPDHPHSGIVLGLAGEQFAATAMVDNFVNPSVIAGRVEVQPLKSLGPLRLGSSFVIDPQAPLQAARAAGARRELDDTYVLTSTRKVLALMGADVEYTLGSDARGSVTPYMDLNVTLLGDVGYHAGATGRLPLGDTGATLRGQLEYRVGTSGYVPAHVETFYDIERYQAGLAFDRPLDASVDERATRLAGMARGSFGGQGLLAQAGVELPRRFTTKLGVSYRPGPDPVSLWWRASTRPIERLDLGLLLVLRGLAGDHAVADGLMTMVEGRFRITDNIYSLAQYARTWVVDGYTTYYGLVHSLNVSVGANWST